MAKKVVKDHSETLGTFDGSKVIGATVAVTNAGDGLSQAMDVEPQLMHHDQVVYLVLRCEVTQVKFVKVNDDEPDLFRVHTLRAGLATLVDGELVKEVLAAQELKLEQAKGIERLPGMSSEGGDEPSGSDNGTDPDGFYDPAADPNAETGEGETNVASITGRKPRAGAAG